MSFLEGLLWLTLNIYHEARGEPEIGQLAVAHVTLNRAISTHTSVGAVVTAPYQFSWTFQKKSYFPAEYDALLQSAHVALKALITADFTKGATFYHRTDVHPPWAADMEFIARYGAHLFYRQNTDIAHTAL
ncbi:MAG: cell wall hydrolase [Desulfobulbus propionicus]|nr:MAG: cell wall hydrolase [Desulfobulbus propionicus]